MRQEINNSKVGGTVTINGQTYSGKNIAVVNNQVYINGSPVNEDRPLTPPITIEVHAPIEELEIQGDVVINGNVEGDLKVDGSVTCENVTGDIEAQGSINCGMVDGDVRAGGSVNCDDVEGDVQAGGSINCDNIAGDAVAGGSIRS